MKCSIPDFLVNDKYQDDLEHISRTIRYMRSLFSTALNTSKGWGSFHGSDSRFCIPNGNDSLLFLIVSESVLNRLLVEVEGGSSVGKSSGSMFSSLDASSAGICSDSSPSG